MLRKLLITLAAVTLVCALISFTMYSTDYANMTEDEAVRLGYLKGGKGNNHHHVKDISIKLQQPRLDPTEEDGFGETPDGRPSESSPTKKVILPDLVKSITFETHFLNVTYPNLRYMNWFKEGVLMAATTDKPVYKPGDTVEVRAYYFNHTDKTPANCSQFAPNLQIIDSKDEVTFSQNFDWKNKCDGNSYVYEYKVPEETKGGVYYVKVYDYSTPESVVKIRIREYHQQSIVKLDYSQETYKPGDEVHGKLVYELIDDTPIPFDAHFSLSTSVGHQISNIELNKDGFGFFSFQIPADVIEDSIFVTFNIHIGDKQTTKSDIITVVQKDNIVLEFTGESGKIVRSVLNRIYFEAFTDDSKSEHADIANAQLVETHGESSTDASILDRNIHTMFNGRGYFDFTPKPSHDYLIRYQGVEHQIHIEQYNEDFELSDFDNKLNVLIKTSTPVVKNEDKLDLVFTKTSSDKKLDLMLAISQKSHILHSEPVSLSNQDTKVTIDIGKLKLVNGGVVSVSLYDTRPVIKQKETNSNYFYYGDAKSSFPYQTIASRSLFILPSKTLQVKFETDKISYSPGDKVKYDITVVDTQTGRAVSDDVFVSLSVTDLSTFLQVDGKRQPASLVSKVYLEKEVKLTDEYEFLNANEYLNYLYQIADGTNDDPNVALTKLELLLGTQKWRLFKFDPIVREDAQHLLYDNTDKLSESQEAYKLKNLWVSQPEVMYANEAMAMDMAVPMARGGANNMRFKTVAAPMQEMAVMEDEEEDGAFEDEENDEVEDDSEQNIDDDFVERINFKETQLFTKFIQTKKGKYSDSFELSDLITKFQVTVDAVSSSGVYGALTSTFSSTKPFYIESAVPFFLTSGDKLSVPVTITNNHPKPVQARLSLSSSLSNSEVEFRLLQSSVTVPAHGTKSVTVMAHARQQTKEKFTVKITAKCDLSSCQDGITQKSRVIGRGFPVQLSHSGFLGTGDSKFIDQASLDFNLNESYEPGTLEAKAKVYTSQLSHIHEALEKLIRDPHGCFEQTSSTTYPLVMALLLMKNLPEKTPEIDQMMIDGTKKLKDGYERLLTFETSDGGYEWFGKSPGHEALSAYGLMQFHEMKDVLSDVDESMIDRVKQWILDRRDGKGSFKMSQNGLDSFGKPPPDLSDAYILWVLTSIGEHSGLEKEIKMVIEKAKASGDTYLYALVANILYNVGRHNEAKDISRILKSHQDSETGEVSNSDTTITRSSGVSLLVETTALSTLAWMKETSGEFAPNIEMGVKYLVSSIKDGKYGSTQGTILSLKVLVEFLKNSKLEGTGTFELSIDNRVIQSYEFNKDTNVSTLDFTEDLEKFLEPNQSLFNKQTSHRLSLKLKDFKGDKNKFRISYSIEATIKDLSPTSNLKSDLDFDLSSNRDLEIAKISDITTYEVKVHNKDAEVGKGMLIAIARIPSCQEVDYNWLERLQSSNKIDFFEVLNDNTDVVLYWRSINPNETKNVQLQMTQAYNADTCIFRPSKAYLYYDEDGSEVWTN